MTGLVHFSVDAASNDVAAPPINFVEGQAANSVNNSMREVMAALARWHVDTAGGLVATGAAGNALLLGSNQLIAGASFDRSFEIAFLVDAFNTAPVDLTIGGQTRSIRRQGGFHLAPGDLQPATVYRASFIPSIGYYLITSPTILRPGMVAWFPRVEAVPAGWIPCDGRTVFRDAYQALYSVVGDVNGAGNGTTTFGIPDLLGRVPFGANSFGFITANRLTGAGGVAGTIGSSGGSETVTLNVNQMPSHNHGGTTGAGGSHNHGGTTGGGGGHNHGGSTGNGGAHSHTGSTDNAGSHTHAGSTNNAGQHDHRYATAPNRDVGATTGASIAGVWYGGTQNVDTGLAGSHDHTFTTNAGGAHTHDFTTSAVAAHDHSIANEAAHGHSILTQSDHAHALFSAGGDQAHPNMPPALCGVWAIKA